MRVAVVPELDLARIVKFCQNRFRAHELGGSRVDLTVFGAVVTLYERGATWHPSWGEATRTPVARLRYEARDRTWTLYRTDRRGRWQRYEHVAPGAVADLLAEIDEDPTGVFWR